MYKNFPDHYIYPAVIEHCEDNYCLYYPDLPGCASSGDTVEKAVELGKAAAQEYLWELEHDGEDIPAATPTDRLSLNTGDAICIVDVNMFPIRAQEKDSRHKPHPLQAPTSHKALTKGD